MTVVSGGPNIQPRQPRERRTASWRRGVLASPAAPVFGALLGVFVLAWIVVTIRGGDFLTVSNIVNMLQRSVALGIVSAGQTVVILLGSLDLSVSQVISLSSLLAATTMDGQSGNVVPAILLVLGVGALIGLANGLIITKLRVNAFIATLGMALIISGIIQNNWDGPAGAVSATASSRSATRGSGSSPRRRSCSPRWCILVYALLRFTRFGYRIYAVGGDEEVSKLSGLRTHRTIVTAHVAVLGAGRGHRAVPGQPARLGHADGRRRRRLRPRVDRRRGARRHGADGRPRRRAGHDRRRLHPRRARQHVQSARGQRVPQGRRPRADHHRRGRGLRAAAGGEPHERRAGRHGLRVRGRLALAARRSRRC